MPYNASISRSNPSCFIFVVDRSKSMEDPFADATKGRKCDGVADALNKLLYNLVIRCAKDEGIRNYYDIAVIGYGEAIESAFSGELEGRSLIPIADLADHPARIEDRASPGVGADQTPTTVKMPIWFDPVAAGGTPMSQAIANATALARGWLDAHPNAFPPLVANITDGESTDGDPSAAMRSLTKLSSSDGNVLLFNLHLSSDPSATPISFPNSAAKLPNAYAKLLFENSSPLTPFMMKTAQDLGLSVGRGAKGFVLNGDLTLVVQTLEIGTRSGSALR
jgi:hypothetical protein